MQAYGQWLANLKAAFSPLKNLNKNGLNLPLQYIATMIAVSSVNRILSRKKNIAINLVTLL